MTDRIQIEPERLLYHPPPPDPKAIWRPCDYSVGCLCRRCQLEAALGVDPVGD